MSRGKGIRAGGGEQGTGNKGGVQKRDGGKEGWTEREEGGKEGQMEVHNLGCLMCHVKQQCTTSACCQKTGHLVCRNMNSRQSLVHMFNMCHLNVHNMGTHKAQQDNQQSEKKDKQNSRSNIIVMTCDNDVVSAVLLVFLCDC